MRQIVLDTETTGLDPKQGHRIVELAAVELVNRHSTGNQIHYYLNPERDSDEAALQVHGLTMEFLSDKPRFTEITKDFLAFIENAELIIHNAPFDVGFLNYEFDLLKMAQLQQYCFSIVDTLKLAKELHPGKRNNLNALCERYSIDNSKRTLHGALLDAELLAEVYLSMTRGQESLLIDLEHKEPIRDFTVTAEIHSLKVIKATDDEYSVHRSILEMIASQNNDQCIWQKLEESD